MIWEWFLTIFEITRICVWRRTMRQLSICKSMWRSSKRQLSTCMSMWRHSNRQLSICKTKWRSSIIIIIIIKKGRQCKAERERYTPYQFEDPSPQYQPIDKKKRKGKRVEDSSRDRAA